MKILNLLHQCLDILILRPIQWLLRKVDYLNIFVSNRSIYGNWWNYRHGFYQHTVDVDGITRDNYQSFIDDRSYQQGHPYNGIFSDIIDNKLYLPYLLKNYSDYFPKYYFYKDSQGLLQMDGENKRVEMERFFDVLSNVHQLVVKPCRSAYGGGFQLVTEISGGGGYRLNNEILDKVSLTKRISKLIDVVITEYVHQAKYSLAIAPNSVNTLRMLCVWDEDSRHFFVARAFHRFGCHGSIVDNLAAGNGILVYVDPKTGIMLSEGVCNEWNKEEQMKQKIVHPDSKVVLSGYTIEGYQTMKTKLLEIADSISFLKYLGFDIAMTDDGFKILEINSLTSLSTIQQRQGFLQDKRIKRILKK